MGNKHRSLATLAMAASLATTVLCPRVTFAQGKPGAAASGTVKHQVVNGPEEDPNMPLLPYAIPGAPLTWSPGRGDAPLVTFFRPRSNGTYLGFNDKGSWIRNQGDGKIYIWNLKDQSLTLGAENDAGVPLDLRNPSSFMKGIIVDAAGHGSSGTTVASNKGKNGTPYIPPGVAGDGNAQYSGGEAPSPAPVTAHPAGASRQIRGTGATIKAGVLTFILDDPASPDNGKPVSLKVMRPMNHPGAAKANGIAGAWLGEDPKNRDVVMSLYVQGENGAVSGTAMTGFAAETLRKIMNANKP
jgi:hypothetical protein